MADISKSYVDYAGLQKYDELLKGKMAADIATEATRATGVESGLQSAINTLNGNDTTAGSVAKAVKDGVDALDAQLADVAKSGEAEDVSYDNTTSGLTATDVQAAIDEVAAASAGGVDSKTVYMVDNGATSAYAKVYNIYQGAEGSASDPEVTELIGTINIPKDKVVEDGSVVTIFYDSTDSSLHEGSISGPDVTALIVGEGTATAADAGKYIKLTLQNVTDPLYIAAQSLVDIYTGGTTAEATVSISNANEITITINAIAASKISHNSTTVEAALNVLEGDSTTAGSVAKAEADAKAYADGLVGALDTSSDVALYSHDTTTGAVTFTGGLAETDGIIEAGSGDDVIFTPVTNAEIQALFASVSA